MTNDYPLNQVLASAQVWADRGAKVHQKWTCQHCGSRQTMGEPNKFHRAGRCEECGQITTITECNYLVII